MTGSPDDLTERMLATVTATADERVELARRLVQTPSVTGTEGALQELIAGRLAASGLEVEVQEVDFTAAAPHLGDAGDRDFTGRPNVVATRRGTGGGRSLLISLHVDTVAPGREERWTHPPYAAVVDGGAIWGRGACDMKGSIAAAVHAVEALADAPLRGDVVIAAAVAEESGGAGTVSYLLGSEPPEAAIVMEPTRLAVVPAHAGATWFRITLTGKNAHACLPASGVSAIEKFVALFGELADYQADRLAEIAHPLFAAMPNAVPVNVGTVRGGDWPAMVPEEVVLEGRIGLVPGEEFGAISEAFEQRLHSWSMRDPWLREHPPRVEWTGARFLPSETPADAEIVTALTRAHRQVLGGEPPIEGVTFGADMTHLVRIGGIPTVMFGPGDIATAHQCDERLPIDELHAATAVLATLILDWCR
jgi:acetylornithine deacetylase